MKNLKRFVSKHQSEVIIFKQFLDFFPLSVHLSEQCKLICKVAGSTAYYQLAKKVIDGTPCSPEKDDICVQGRCLVSCQFTQGFVLFSSNNENVENRYTWCGRHFITCIYFLAHKLATWCYSLYFAQIYGVQHPGTAVLWLKYWSN